MVNPPAPLEPLRTLLNKWFYKPDFQAIRIVMGTMAAHYLNLGDAAWLFVVAPPGSGKTTTSIMGAAGLPTVQVLSDFTENTFLSGFHGHVTPGLLEKLGPVQQRGEMYTTTGNGIILAKDFTSVLSMRREKRAAILGQLREIHDGMFRKDYGTGVTKIWCGKVTIIAAVTPRPGQALCDIFRSWRAVSPGAVSSSRLRRGWGMGASAARARGKDSEGGPEGGWGDF